MKFWALLPGEAEKMKKLVVTENWGIHEAEILQKELQSGQYIARVNSEEDFVENKTSYHLTILDNTKNDIGTLDISLDNRTGEFSLINKSGSEVADLYIPAITFLELYNQPDESEFDVKGDGEIEGLIF